jgi:hypothetical protein
LQATRAAPCLHCFSGLRILFWITVNVSWHRITSLTSTGFTSYRIRTRTQTVHTLSLALLLAGSPLEYQDRSQDRYGAVYSTPNPLCWIILTMCSIASIENIANEPAERSTAAAFTRDNDPLTIALRCKGTFDFDDLVHLDQARSLISDTAASTSSASTGVFSSHEASSDTKHTSIGTSYPLYDSEGKRRDTVDYSSSLSATHGSGSEAELEMEASQRIDLIGTGSWMSDNSTSKSISKDSTGREPRDRKRNGSRKKPSVAFHSGKG